MDSPTLATLLLDPSLLLGDWEKRGFNPRGKTLLLAVSGGADSMAMLRYFCDEIAPRRNCRLVVGHVDHGLRPESGQDAAWLKAECLRLDLPFLSHTLRPETRGRRESTEAWARRGRYAALEAMAGEKNTDHILTAHHREDWIETVFIRLSRGETWRAWLGMPFSRDPGIIRPFLHLAPDLIRRYLELTGQSWREDASNGDKRFLRNRLRHQILPGLEEAWPNWREGLLAIGSNMRELKPQIERLEQGPLPYIREEGGFGLALEALDEPHAAGDPTLLLSRLREWMAWAGGPKNRPSRAFLGGFKPEAGAGPWMPAPGWLLERRLGPPNPAYLLSKVAGKTVRIGQNTAKACLADPQHFILDILPREWEFSLFERRYRLRARRLKKPDRMEFPKDVERRAIFDGDSISSTLVIRSRLAGDRFCPLGTRSSTRKLKDYLREKGVPVDLRDSLPLVFSENTLAWVPGFGLADGFKVTSKTDTLLELVLECLTPMTHCTTKTTDSSRINAVK